MENGISTIIYQRSYDEIASQLFVCLKTVYRTIRTFLNTGDVKPCHSGRPFGSVTLFEHEEYILMECILQAPQIQLHEIDNHIFNATGSVFSPQTLCTTIYRLGITRKKVSHSQEVKIYSLLHVVYRNLKYVIQHVIAKSHDYTNLKNVVVFDLHLYTYICFCR